MESLDFAAIALAVFGFFVVGFIVLMILFVIYGDKFRKFIGITQPENAQATAAPKEAKEE